MSNTDGHSAGHDSRPCPACAETIRISARYCRFCGAILTSDPLPEFLPRDVVALLAQRERQAEGSDSASASANRTNIGVNRAISSVFAETGIEMSLQHRYRVETFLRSASDERRSATVLFIDINGYTAICQRNRNPEDVKRLILDPYYALCVDVVDRCNGFVVKFVGDACVAVFGAPVAYERDAESGVRAALEIQARVRAFPKLLNERLSVSAGLETGEILSSMVRTGEATYDVFGDTVNLAARIQGSAGHDAVLIGPVTRDLVGTHFKLRELAPHEFKNVAQPIVTFEVLGLAVREPERPETPLFGREHDLEHLLGCWEAFRSGVAAQGIGVIGESGVGKTRLLHEFVQRLNGEAQQFWTENAPHASRSAYAMWRSVLAAVAGRPHADGQLADSIESLLAFAGISSSDAVALLAMAGAEDAVNRLAHVDPLSIRRMILSDLRNLLARLSAKQPLLLVLDDLQWADATSLEILNAILAREVPPGLFVVAAWRPDFDPAAMLGLPEGGAPSGLRSIERIDLSDLDVTAAKCLLDYLAAARHLPADVHEALAQRIAGNPCELIELIDAVCELLKAANTRSETRKIIEQLDELLPKSVGDMLQRRIYALEPGRKIVLQCCAVLGTRFRYSLLEVFPEIRDGLLADLYALKNLGFLQEDLVDGELEFRFRHHAVREAVCHAMLDRQRRGLHRAFAERIEMLHGEDPAWMDLLAWHFSQSDEHERAVHYLKASGERARKLAATREAIDAFRLAIDTLGRCDATRSNRFTRVLVHRGLGNMLSLKGEQSLAIEQQSQALELARKMQLDQHAALALVDTGRFRSQGGDYAAAERDLKAGLRVLRKEGNAIYIAGGLTALGECMLNQGRLAVARRLFRRVTRTPRIVRLKPETLADAHNNLALIALREGKLGEAEEEFRRAVALYRKINNRFGTAATTMNLGIVLENTGKYKQAERAYRDSLQLAERIYFQVIQTAAHANLANLALARNDGMTALSHSSRSLELANASGDPRSAAIALENIALSQLVLGDFEESRRAMEQGLAVAAELGDAERTASLRMLECELDLRRGASNGVPTLLESVDATIDRLGMAGERPRLLRLRGMLAVAQDDSSRAAALLQQAVAEARRQGNQTEERRATELLAPLTTVP